MAGRMGLADLGDDLRRGLIGDARDGQLEQVAFGNRRVKAGAGMKVHQFADDGQAEVGYEDFRGTMLGSRMMHAPLF